MSRNKYKNNDVGRLVLLSFIAFSGLTGCISSDSAIENNKGKKKPSVLKAEQQSRPNILFIMSDDHAEKAISAYGHQLIQTPNIDRIANEGILFTKAFVTNSICGPSRAVLMTGKHSHINGFMDNGEDTIFDGSQSTFPKLLQKAGYETSIVGKWHLGSDPTGFDNWQILVGQGEYYSPQFKSKNGIVQYDGAYVTNKITDLLIEQLDNRDKSKPFAMLYHHKAPHRNWMADVDLLANDDLAKEFPTPESFTDAYQGRPAAKHQDMRIADMYLGWDMKLQPGEYPKETGTGGYRHQKNFDTSKAADLWAYHYNRMNAQQKAIWDDYYQDLAAEYKQFKDNPVKLAAWMYQRYMHDYLATVRSVDNNVGRVLDYLDDNGLSENTVVVYTSDQGFYLGEHGWFDKRFMYEESMSTPLIIRYPAMINAGQVTDKLVQNIDFAPTFIDLSGESVPAEMQGLSLKPLLAGDVTINTSDSWRTGIYYQYFEYPTPHAVMPHYGIRTDRYKLIHFQGDDGHWELYDLGSDPQEMQNKYHLAEYAQVRRDLHQQLTQLRSEYKVAH